MVSTRGSRYKFTDGERVLCYEPDPTKAKVLYDSKVLEVIEGKDKRGRRCVEYLIHFQGWNSSWDRCVSEDFVLKDTDENRQLQRDLAEKSQLQLGSYLYRRERKKVTPVPAKRPRQGFSDDGSSTSTQPDVETGGEGDTDSSQGSAASQVSAALPAQPPRAVLPLPSTLKDRLTYDYHLIGRRGRLSALPASPSAADILEAFVKWFARSGAWRPPAGSWRPPDPPVKPDLLDVCCRLNLVREVADGLRIYFDFVLGDHLLYKQEHEQYHEMCGKHIEKEEELAALSAECDEYSEEEGSDEQEEEGDEEEEEEEEEEDDGEEEGDELADAENCIKSPNMPEYAHLPPDPILDGRSDSKDSSSQSPPGEMSEGGTEFTDKEDMKDNDADKDTDKGADDAPNDNGTASEERTTRSVTVARRLRSHKSAVSPSESEEAAPAPSTSASAPERNDARSSSLGSCSGGSSISSVWVGAQPAPRTAPAPPARNPLSQLLDKVAKWQIIPRDGTEHLPCRVYGAIHLARLFVKIPDFLNATHMSDAKLKLVLQHIDMFVQFLDEHNEWFGEMYYVAADSIGTSQ